MRNWLIGLVGLAWVLWTIMFAPPLASHVPFWVAMPISGTLLVLISSLYDRSWLKLLRFGLTDVLMGIGIALLLWGCFYIGNAVARVMFNFSEQQIGAIYALKEDMNPWLLSGLMLCIIGPAEEIVWMGIVQRHRSLCSCYRSVCLGACGSYECNANTGSLGCWYCVGWLVPLVS